MTPAEARPDIVGTLATLHKGDGSGAERLFSVLYDELRVLAARHLRREPRGRSMQTTELVHEAYLRLVGQRDVDWQNRAHFFAIAAQAIRRVLIDHARHRQIAKRGGGWHKVTLHEALDAPGEELDFPALHEALDRLMVLHERQARIVEMRFFGGLSVEDVVHVLGVSRRTVERDWKMAKAWLRLELKENGKDKEAET